MIHLQTSPKILTDKEGVVKRGVARSLKHK